MVIVLLIVIFSHSSLQNDEFEYVYDHLKKKVQVVTLNLGANLPSPLVLSSLNSLSLSLSSSTISHDSFLLTNRDSQLTMTKKISLEITKKNFLVWIHSPSHTLFRPSHPLLHR